MLRSPRLPFSHHEAKKGHGKLIMILATAGAAAGAAIAKSGR